MKLYAPIALATLAIGSFASAQTLSTAPSNNGSGGVFLSLTALNEDLFVTQFDVPFNGTEGTIADVEIYTRTGGYAGFTGSSEGWNFLGTFSTTRAGITVNAPIVLDNFVLLTQGQTTSFYLHALGTLGTGIRYTGTGGSPPQTTWSNGDLELFSDTARTGGVPFGGTAFEPRTFSGTVHYQPIPEPMTLGALALGGLLIARRRRRS